MSSPAAPWRKYQINDICVYIDIYSQAKYLVSCLWFSRLLADTKKLVRTFPNPMLLQIAQVLQAREKKKKHVPFSGKASINPETIRTYIFQYS